MTKQENIEELNSLLRLGSLTGLSSQTLEAIKEATIVYEEQEPCEDAISRKSIKQKLQEHHDFFVSAYGGFSNLPQNDKSRVDEITNCIAMVVNEPPVKPQELKTGRWVEENVNGGGRRVFCSECGCPPPFEHISTGDVYSASGYGVINKTKFCPNCGIKMESEETT